MYDNSIRREFARKLVRLHDSDRGGPLVKQELYIIKLLCNGTDKNVVNVFKAGMNSNETIAYIDMELCEMNLAEYRRGMQSYGLVHTPIELKASQIWDVMEQIANGLAFVHSTGYVHRDLKPQNGLKISVVY
jgi:serine/threonine protein kinase